MEKFIAKYSKWFPYCEKEKLIEEMRQDLSAMAEPKNENSGSNKNSSRKIGPNSRH